MKPQTKLIFAFLIIGVALTHFFSCSSKTGDFHKSKTDSVDTWVDFVTPYDRAWVINGIEPNNGMRALLRKVITDTLIFDSVDANTLTKQWKRDSFYIAVLNQPIMDTVTKQQKKDSSGRPLFKPPISFILDKKFILHDYNSNPNKP